MILLGFRYLASSIPSISLAGVAIGVGLIGKTSIYLSLLLHCNYLSLLGSIDGLGTNDTIIYWMILILTLGSVIGMILNRNLLLKFFLCFESFFFIMSTIIIIWSCSSNGIIIILYLLWNSTFEVILGLTMSYLLKIYRQ